MMRNCAHRKALGREAGNVCAGGAAAVERLEPRVLLSTYGYESLAEHFDLDRAIREVQAREGEAGFGAVVVGLGDVDGDGGMDFAVSAPGVRSEGLGLEWSGGPGSVRLYSGRTMSVIRVPEGEVAGFGAALANPGDVDGDGVADLAVGSPGEAGGAGRVWVFSGANGGVIASVEGALAGGALGWALAATGDVDGDGVGDVLIGEPGADRAWVCSGADLAAIHIFEGEAAGSLFGYAVASGRSVPAGPDSAAGDGVNDFLIGAPGFDAEGVEDAGAAYGFSGADGSALVTLVGEVEGGGLGTAVAMRGTTGLAADMFTWVAGAPGDGGGDGRGAVRFYAFSGSEQGATIGRSAGEGFGAALYTLGDLDGSGRDHIGALARGGEREATTFYLLPDHQEGIPQEPPAAIAGARSVAYLGDADGDGNLDVVAGFVSEGGGRAAVVPFPLVRYAPLVTAASEDGRWMVLSGGVAPQNDRPQGWLVRHGELVALGSVEGLMPGESVVAVNNAGLMVAQTDPARGWSSFPLFGAAALEEFAFVFDGERALLSEAIVSVDGERPAELSLVKLSNAGDAVFQGGYLFRGGVLRRVWEGRVGDVNDLGVIVGTRDGAGVMFTAAGRVVEAPGLASALAINDAGTIVGRTAGGDLAAVDGRSLRVIASPAELIPEGTLLLWVVVTDVSEDGRVVFEVAYQDQFPTAPRAPFVFIPGRGVERLGDVVVGEPRGALRAPLRVTDDGGLLIGRDWIGERLDPTSLPGVGARLAGGAGVSTTVAGGVVYTAGINEAGEPIVLRQRGDGGGWEGLVLPYRGSQPVGRVVLYTDARDGRAYAFVLARGEMTWFVQTPEGFFDEREVFTPGDRIGGLFVAPTRYIPAEAGVYTTPDGRVVLYGLSGGLNGEDVVVFYQTGGAAPDARENWASRNLTEELAERGVAAPAAAGNLTAFATPWGSEHIGFLDEAGRVQVVWRAPGADQWDVVDLSEASGAPALSGNLTSFVTPWHTLHLSAVDAEGEVVAVWWAPGFGGQWAATRLFDGAGGGAEIRLRPETIAAFTTPWHALNFVGIDEQTGEVAVYWWAPETNRWAAERLTFEPAPGESEAILPAAELVGGSRAAGQDIFGRSADGELAHLLWNVGDGAVWTSENLTGSVA